ncbi:antitoxin VapB family protein [Haloplanus halobius]|uniref:antitoxin VapB family protein n=1 Tax=Haloplanus halobius TaxID=2934938 RepID=UPI00200EC0CB|nr:antitoxin VapB family protein [Haloplanus sp. XH21]
MPVELETRWHPSTKLNAIGSALDFTRVDPLPENVTRDQIEEFCYTLEQLYGEYVDELVAETTLSKREAQTWVLRNLVHEGADRLTFDAIGLYIWAIGRATDGDPLSRTIVAAYHDRAREKIDAAEATIKRTQPPPYPDDLFEDPSMLWVEGSVADRLGRRLGPEESYSDVIERLLDETLATVDLETLIEAFRDAGATFVGVQTVRPDWDRELPLSVHGAASTPPDAVAGADAVVVDGTPYPFRIGTRPPDAGTDSLLSLFDREESAPAGVDRLRRALEAVDATLSELVERVREAGLDGVAMADQPVGAGAHLLVIGDAVPDGIAHLDRLLLDDRTLTVTRVTAVSAAEYADRNDATLLWTATDADLPETRLPADPVERRERVPTAVCRTG